MSLVSERTEVSFSISKPDDNALLYFSPTKSIEKTTDTDSSREYYDVKIPFNEYKDYIRELGAYESDFMCANSKGYCHDSIAKGLEFEISREKVYLHKIDAISGWSISSAYPVRLTLANFEKEKKL